MKCIFALLAFAFVLTSCEEDENKKIEEQVHKMNQSYRQKSVVVPVSGNTTEYIENTLINALEEDRQNLPIAVDEGLMLIDIRLTDDALEYVYDLSPMVNVQSADWDSFDKFYTHTLLDNARASDLLIRYCMRMLKPIKYIVLSEGKTIHVLNIPMDTIMQLS